MTDTQTELHVEIRWFIHGDVPEVLEIENACFEYVWTEEDFKCALSQRNCIGMVAEHNNHVVGFMIYELHKERLRILNFAVHPAYQRQGVGTQMINRLKGKLPQQRRKEIDLIVRDGNLDAHLFFRSQGFQAIDIFREYYEECGDDGYLLSYLRDET